MEVEKIDILAEMAKGLDKTTLVAARVRGDSMVDANIATTYDSYVRVTDEMSDEAVSILDTVLSTEKNSVDKP